MDLESPDFVPSLSTYSRQSQCMEAPKHEQVTLSLDLLSFYVI